VLVVELPTRERLKVAAMCADRLELDAPSHSPSEAPISLSAFIHRFFVLFLSCHFLVSPAGLF
jgi:hypothetical protein